MKEKQVKRFVQSIFEALKSRNLVEWKAKEEEVFQRAISIVNSDFQREKELDEEVNQMLDDLEKQNPGSFQRYKMFPLLKRKLAEKKGIVL